MVKVYNACWYAQVKFHGHTCNFHAAQPQPVKENAVIFVDHGAERARGHELLRVNTSTMDTEYK